MQRQFVGQCQCGHVQYQVDGEPVTMFACHCTECQRQSGSAFGLALWVRHTGVQLLQGALKEWVRTMPSGRAMACRFCPECGTRLFHQVVDQPEVLSIKPGTLHDAADWTPVAHMWVDSKLSWVTLTPDGAMYSGNPDSVASLCAAWNVAHHI